MAKTVSATDAQSRLGSMLRWAEENDDGVIIERRGKPAGVLITYDEYLSLIRYRERDRKIRALGTLRALRQRVQAENTDLTAEEAYRMAGLDEDVIRRTVERDEAIVREA